MTVTNDFDVLRILQEAVIAAVEESITPTLPIKVIGRTITPPDGTNAQKYVEIVWIPNNPTNDFWGDEQNHMGMLRLVLHWPNDDEGAYPPGEVAASISAGLAHGKLLGNAPGRLQIYSGPNMMTPIETPTETLYPFGLRYCSFRQN